MKLKDVLRELLKKHNMTVARLSRTVNIPTATLHGWLNGVEPKNIGQLKKVANHFEVSLDYLCFATQDSEKQKIQDFEKEINAGLFEVVLRRVKN